jgi:hypothetical protein
MDVGHGQRNLGLQVRNINLIGLIIPGIAVRLDRHKRLFRSRFSNIPPHNGNFGNPSPNPGLAYSHTSL